MSTTDTQSDIRLRLKTPSLWKVVLHNDDFTPMEFVTQILIQLFSKTHREAEELMLTVHRRGRATVGLFTKDIAITKAQQVRHAAEANSHPLMATAEEA
jgi:ATP-dependent Clp protease adaptor protein ClpS